MIIANSDLTQQSENDQALFIPSASGRRTFTFSRQKEFFSRREFAMQVGCPYHAVPTIALREIIDNSLDACEAVKIAPEIEVTIRDNVVSVRDNGPGLPKSTVLDALDYETRTSSNIAYVGPSRGQLGNALKCLFAAPFVMSSDNVGRVTVHSHGRQLDVHLSFDEVHQVPIVSVNESASDVKTGTLIESYWNSANLVWLRDECVNGFEINTSAVDLLDSQSWANAHARFKLTIDEQVLLERLATGKKKWAAAGPTAIDWYSPALFQDLFCSTLKDDSDKNTTSTVAMFIKHFDGLSKPSKQNTVLERCGLKRKSTLQEFVDGNSVDSEKLSQLKAEIQSTAGTFNPKRLGKISKATIRKHFENEGAIDDDCFKYASSTIVVDGVPFIIELAAAWDSELIWRLKRYTVRSVLNWSAQLEKDPAYLMNHVCSFGANDAIDIVVSLISPRLEFTNKGKNELDLPRELKAEIGQLADRVFAPWRAIKKRYGNQQRRKRTAAKGESIGQYEACSRYVAEAYEHAAGKLGSVGARQVMYATRKLVVAAGLPFYKNDANFTQDFLPRYIAENPETTKHWNVCYNNRGSLTEPHTGRVINIGTNSIREYVAAWTSENDATTIGPINRYSAIIFIEKTGFDDLIASYGLRELYDIGTMSTQGQSSTSSRLLIDELAPLGIPILCLRDFDKSGCEISTAIAASNHRYEYRNTPLVRTIGLTLKDALGMGLEGEPVRYGKANGSKKKIKDPRESLKRCGCTQLEIDFLVSDFEETESGVGQYVGRRIELNEMTAEQLIDLLIKTLDENGISKVVPKESLLSDQFQSQLREIRVAKRLAPERKKIEAEERKRIIDVPDDLGDLIRSRIANKKLSWDAALSSVVADANVTN